MALSKNRTDRELAKFTEIDGETAVRTTAQGEFRLTGLNVGGFITEVEINNISWTKLPLNNLPERKTIAIQNFSGDEIKLNYDSSISGYIGIIVKDGVERQYDITENIDIYARSKNGSATIIIEELA